MRVRCTSLNPGLEHSVGYSGDWMDFVVWDLGISGPAVLQSACFVSCCSCFAPFLHLLNTHHQVQAVAFGMCSLSLSPHTYFLTVLNLFQNYCGLRALFTRLFVPVNSAVLGALSALVPDKWAGNGGRDAGGP